MNQPPVFYDVLVVGMHFRSAEERQVASALLPGDKVTPEREPENPYDSLAIKIIYKDYHIGYIAAANGGPAGWIAPWMDDGWTFEATVTGLEQRKNNIHPLLKLVPVLPDETDTATDRATLLSVG